MAEPGPRGAMQVWATRALAALSVAAVAAGLWVAGGPARARMERQDEARESDLMRLSAHIDCLALDGRMPADLAETDRCPGPIRRADPYTGTPYRVEPLAPASYRLCADFALPPDAGSLHPRRDGDCIVRDLPHAQAGQTRPADPLPIEPFR